MGEEEEKTAPATETVTATAAEEEPLFNIPTWAGRPPPGLHLDVFKGDKLLQKLMIDDKRAYYFGRNPTQVDFVVDHASASRVHAVLIFHKFLGRAFLVDLGSSHGTFIGGVRLEAKKPEQLMVGQAFRLGASTRSYTLRERLSQQSSTAAPQPSASALPAKEEELENLTEYNTALNRRIGSMVTMEESGNPRKRKHLSVAFVDEEDVINPEDVDPSIGRFRNLVATTLIRKRGRMEEAEIAPSPASSAMRRQVMAASRREVEAVPGLGISAASLNLGLSLPNPAPDLAAQDLYADIPLPASVAAQRQRMPQGSAHSAAAAANAMDDVASKKVYAKEAWPGRNKPQHNF